MTCTRNPCRLDNCEDAILCDQYARQAVHAAFAGKSGLVVGMHDVFIRVPTERALPRRR